MYWREYRRLATLVKNCQASVISDIRLDVFVSVQKQQGRGILVEVRRRLTLFHCSAAVDRTTGSRNWRGKAAPVLDGTRSTAVCSAIPIEFKP